MKDSEGGEKEGKYYRLFQDIGFLLIFRKLSQAKIRSATALNQN